MGFSVTPSRSRYVDALPDIDQQLENAVTLGDLQWVKDCVKKGANVNCGMNERGSTPLIMAVAAGWISVVKYLVEMTDLDLEAVDSAATTLRTLLACTASPVGRRWVSMLR